MASKTASANIGSKHLSGVRQAAAAPAGASADVSVTFDAARITTKSDFMAACEAIANQLFSS